MDQENWRRWMKDLSNSKHWYNHPVKGILEWNGHYFWSDRFRRSITPPPGDTQMLRRMSPIPFDVIMNNDRPVSISNNMAIHKSTVTSMDSGFGSSSGSSGFNTIADPSKIGQKNEMTTTSCKLSPRLPNFNEPPPLYDSDDDDSIFTTTSIEDTDSELDNQTISSISSVDPEEQTATMIIHLDGRIEISGLPKDVIRMARMLKKSKFKIVSVD